MKIDFISFNQDLRVGSYRIWIHNVRKILQEMNHDVRIVSSYNETRDDSVVIFSKGDYQKAKNLNQKRLIGAINVDPSHSEISFDFVICGSIEEKMSLQSLYENVFIINLIEIDFENQKRKNHKQKDDLIIGYHGSYTHLNKLSNGFVESFREIKKSVGNVKLKIITDRPDKAVAALSSLGMREEDVISKKWEYDTFVSDLLEVDIGIVPNVTFIDRTIPVLRSITSTDDGLYGTDYFLRFKNKSNPGRSFVFFQLGIPVISDLTPSGMPMLYDEKCGAVANCKNTWVSSLRRFLNADERNKTANIAYNRFIQMYDIRKDVQHFIENLERMKNDQ